MLCFMKLMAMVKPDLGTHWLSSDEDLSSKGNSQCFGASGVVSRQRKNGYHGQDFLFHVLHTFSLPTPQIWKLGQ